MDTVWILALVWVLSALTLTTGVGAGVVYAPVFLLFFQMSPAMATGTSIVTACRSGHNACRTHPKGRDR